MVGDISSATRTEVLGAIHNQYTEGSKKDKGRMLDEFVAIAECHRKHAVRLLYQSEDAAIRTVPKGRRIYDEAVRQALIVARRRRTGYVERGSRQRCPAWWNLWRGMAISLWTQM